MALPVIFFLFALLHQPAPLISFISFDLLVAKGLNVDPVFLYWRDVSTVIDSRDKWRLLNIAGLYFGHSLPVRQFPKQLCTL